MYYILVTSNAGLFNKDVKHIQTSPRKNNSSCKFKLTQVDRGTLHKCHRNSLKHSLRIQSSTLWPHLNNNFIVSLAVLLMAQLPFRNLLTPRPAAKSHNLVKKHKLWIQMENGKVIWSDRSSCTRCSTSGPQGCGSQKMPIVTCDGGSIMVLPDNSWGTFGPVIGFTCSWITSNVHMRPFSKAVCELCFKHWYHIPGNMPSYTLVDMFKN